MQKSLIFLIFCACRPQLDGVPGIWQFTHMTREVRLRFAPSHNRTFAYCGYEPPCTITSCQKNGMEKFLLRIEDTDQNRFLPVGRIHQKIHWNGSNIPLKWKPVNPGILPSLFVNQSANLLYMQYCAWTSRKKVMPYYAFDYFDETKKPCERLDGKPEWCLHNTKRITRTQMKNRWHFTRRNVAAIKAAVILMSIRVKNPSLKREVRLHHMIRGCWWSIPPP